jgi:hypothetical protein
MVASAASTILDRVIDPHNPDLSPEAAHAFLRIRFRQTDHERMTELTTKSREGNISESEREELEGYMEVGLLIDLLQSKARISLKNPSSGI